MDNCKESQNRAGQSNLLYSQEEQLLPGLDGQTLRSLLNPKPKHALKSGFWTVVLTENKTRATQGLSNPKTRLTGWYGEAIEEPLKPFTGVRPVLKPAKRNASITHTCSEIAEGPSRCHACQG